MAQVAHSMSECEIAAGDRLIEQGRKNDHFFIVNKGAPLLRSLKKIRGPITIHHHVQSFNPRDTLQAQP